MNVSKLVTNLASLKNLIKRAVPDGGYVTPELMTIVKKSNFALTLQRYNLLNQLDNINVTTFEGTVNLTINSKKVNVSTFTNYLDKGDLIGALKSIGIPKKNLKYGPIQQRAKQFKAQLKSSKMNRLEVSLVSNRTLAGKLRRAFNLPEITITIREVDVIKKFLTDKFFTKRILAPLYHKLKASPTRIPWLKGIALGTFTTFVGLLVKRIFQFMRDTNGCWLYPKLTSTVTQECKVNLLTCNENYKSVGLNLCTTKCKGSDGDREYPCFQEAALKLHCKNFKPHVNTPLCGTKKSCSWACSDKNICVPKDKELRCVNYTFWEAFVAVTKDYLPDLDLDYTLVILIAIGSFIFLFWLLR